MQDTEFSDWGKTRKRELKRPALDPCPLETVFAMVAGKWKARILLLLSLSPRTFAELRRALPGIRQQVLSTQLKELVRDKLIERERIVEGAPHSIYTPTPLADGLMEALNPLSAWGERHLDSKGLKWVRPMP